MTVGKTASDGLLAVAGGFGLGDPKMKQHSDFSWAKWALPAVLVLSGAAASVGITSHWPNSHAQEPDSKAQAGMHEAAELSNAFRFVASKLRPSVVSVQTKTEVKMEARSGRGRGGSAIPGIPKEFERFFGEDLFEQAPRGPMRQEGQGTGVIIGADGLIVTNNHVIRGAGSHRRHQRPQIAHCESRRRGSEDRYRGASYPSHWP